jgi:hypothetical protein
MKCLARLPQPQNYRTIPSGRDDQFWFVDKATVALRIRSPIPDPFSGQLWKIMFSPVEQTADNSKYRIKLDLKLFEPSTTDTLQVFDLERSIVKGRYIYLKNGFIFPLCNGEQVPHNLIYELK